MRIRKVDGLPPPSERQFRPRRWRAGLWFAASALMLLLSLGVLWLGATSLGAVGQVIEAGQQAADGVLVPGQGGAATASAGAHAELAVYLVGGGIVGLALAFCAGLLGARVVTEPDWEAEADA